ncbi:uncharacterized protein MYCFIDRAFT_174538 [Pseudocercospora fijiensis CIRAD86]|uniref:Uncharacterized protein n=1 Tax=Pseudocercospora fijiensis (strain CIRAD86) TaxID=383855 RepID=M2YZJ9_PSEFD|nr:uncharacterized protein MYCFIDRAFT_174538 [Pseudocercospora fijiensis CIRAD86]EME83050.1 hypothetical protein MYCFIDRAFT_174538 [Pseudocercospora fijiensis CIRAD86]
MPVITSSILRDAVKSSDMLPAKKVQEGVSLLEVRDEDTCDDTDPKLPYDP